MTKSAYKTLPSLQGSLVASTPFSTLLGRPDYLVYPFQLGVFTKAYSAGVVTSFSTCGVGEFTVGDYVLPCRPTSYGGTWFYVPDLTSLTRVTAVGTIDDTVDISPGITQTGLMYLFNLGADTASNPLVTPNYDGSNISLYLDPIGAYPSPQPYIITNPGGMFAGWLETGVQVCSLLVCNSSGAPLIAIPQFQCGTELLA